MVMAYGPNEGDGEERERFWNDIEGIVDRVGNVYRLCVVEDLNGWIEDRVRTGIPGDFGVPDENHNGRRVAEFCTSRELCVRNAYFERKSLHKYTRAAKGQVGVEVKSMIDLVYLHLHYVQVLRGVRGVGRGITDSHVVLCNVRVVGSWIRRREVLE